MPQTRSQSASRQAVRVVSPTRRLSSLRDGGAVHPTPETKDLSIAMNLLLVFLSHGWVNTVLLTPLNPLRCGYWDTDVKTQGCSISNEEGTMMNWMASAMFHVNMLLSCLAYTAAGNPVLEQRLLLFVMTLVVGAVSSGIFYLEEIARPMAALQVIIWSGFLFTALFVFATEYASDGAKRPPLRLLKSTSFDTRLRLPICTVAVGIQAVLSIVKIVNRTFIFDGLLLSLESAQYSNPTVQSISQVALMNELWATLLISACVLLATETQQKTLLAGQAVSLFVCVLLLLNDTYISMSTRQSEITGAASAFVLALMGAFT